MELTPLFNPVAAPENKTAQVVLDQLRGDIGRLGEVAAWVAACQGQVPPSPLKRCRVVVFAGDHGIASRGVSAVDPGESRREASIIEGGGGPLNVLARAARASIRVVDISLEHEAWGDERVSRSSGAIDVEDAMTLEQFQRAMTVGQNIADQEIDSGADLLIPGDLGVGNMAVAATVVGAFTRTEPVVVVGSGIGITDEIWKARVTVVRDAMFRVRGLATDPLEVLRMASSPDFVALVGFIAQAAQRRTPVLLDGALVTAAAYVAEKLSPGARGWFWAGQLSPEPAHLIALQALDLTPLLALDMSTGQGAGALAALPLVTSAVEMVAEGLSTE